MIIFRIINFPFIKQNLFIIHQLAENLPPSILKGPLPEDTGVENRTKTLTCEVAADKSDPLFQILWYVIIYLFFIHHFDQLGRGQKGVKTPDKREVSSL